MPMFQKGAIGRDHNPDGFTGWLAGAGVRRAFSHGATDEFGYQAVEDVSRSTTCTPRSCTCSVWTTSGSPSTTTASTAASPTCMAM